MNEDHLLYMCILALALLPFYPLLTITILVIIAIMGTVIK
jgi:hypothetical protein